LRLLGIYAHHVNCNGADLLAFVAAGAIASGMWLAESRALSLIFSGLDYFVV